MLLHDQGTRYQAPMVYEVERILSFHCLQVLEQLLYRRFQRGSDHIQYDESDQYGNLTVLGIDEQTLLMLL